MARTNEQQFITRRPNNIASKLNELRRDWLNNPEAVGFRRLDNSICYKKFKQKAVVQYKDGSKTECVIPVVYSDIDFNWGWSSENGKVNGNSNWKGYHVGGLYCTIDGVRHFLAKVTPLLSMSIDAGIRAYINQDCDENRNPIPGSRSVMYLFLDSPARVIDEAKASDESLPFGNASAAPVAEDHV